MTYHMARVGHWIQNQSVDYYLSHIDRQNAMNPGAEFLILIPQVIFHSDIFANLIQSFAWLYCVAIVLVIAFIIKAENYKRIFATIFAASLPMGILQATSTQNDLLASAFCLSLIGNHFFLKKQIETGKFPGSKWILLIAYSVSIFSAYLVKPTSLLFASFFVLSSLFHLIAFFWKNRTEFDFIKSLLKLVPVFVVSGLIVLGPDVVRKYNQYGSLTGNRSEVFSLDQGMEVRFANTLKGMFYHSPFSFFYASSLLIFSVPKYKFFGSRSLFYFATSIMIAQSWMVLALNASRPFRIVDGTWNREWHYFSKRPELRNVYANFIEYIKRNQIGDVGLVLNGDSWDYPLTWQLMQNDVKVDYVKVPADTTVIISDSLVKIDGYSVVSEGQGFFLFLRNSN